VTVNLKLPPIHIVKTDMSSAVLSRLVFAIFGSMCFRQRRAVNWVMILQRERSENWAV